MNKTQREFDNRDKFIELGYNIAYYRKHAGLTQEQLSELVGISRQHLGAIEAPNLVRPISLELLFNIAAVLAVKQDVAVRRIKPCDVSAQEIRLDKERIRARCRKNTFEFFFQHSFIITKRTGKVNDF